MWFSRRRDVSPAPLNGPLRPDRNIQLSHLHVSGESCFMTLYLRCWLSVTGSPTPPPCFLETTINVKDYYYFTTPLWCSALLHATPRRPRRLFSSWTHAWFKIVFLYYPPAFVFTSWWSQLKAGLTRRLFWQRSISSKTNVTTDKSLCVVIHTQTHNKLWVSVSDTVNYVENPCRSWNLWVFSSGTLKLFFAWRTAEGESEWREREKNYGGSWGLVNERERSWFKFQLSVIPGGEPLWGLDLFYHLTFTCQWDRRGWQRRAEASSHPLTYK